MFIPRGKIVHENLATSYVLLEALVADLCEGGFSGAVEVVLRDFDGFIIIVSGNVSAVVEKRNEHDQSGRVEGYKRENVSELAARARLERGRVSIYGYSAATANAVAGRINAESLYARLSVEFTNLEKMISKLAHEADREWFIEVNMDSGLNALLHMRDGRCQLIKSTQASDDEPGSLDPANNSALRGLLDECQHAGGTFDVYFRPPAGTIGASVESGGLKATSVGAVASPATPADNRLVPPETWAGEFSGVSGREGSFVAAVEPREEGREARGGDSSALRVPVSASRSAIYGSGGTAFERATLEGSEADSIGPHPKEVSSGEVIPVVSGDEAMLELKRLMGEIARTVEEAAQAVDRHDGFSMALRAGQLKIADQYPFLDPFRNEFEYLAGEIVFVGQATAEDFVAGLTEALELAILGVARATEHGDRFRAYVTEDLRKLLARDRSELERFGLDQVIEHLLTDGLGSQVGKGGLPPLR
jgi:hypothetical protein